MCNANSILTEHFAEHKFHSTYPKFQRDITSNSILQKGGNVQISPQNVRLRVFGFPQKRPVKHHVFLNLFGSGSGTLRVSKSQTCPALSLLSWVFISGSRVFGNPVAHVNSKSLWVIYFVSSHPKSSWVIKTSYFRGPPIQNPINCDSVVITTTVCRGLLFTPSAHLWAVRWPNSHGIPRLRLFLISFP